MVGVVGGLAGVGPPGVGEPVAGGGNEEEVAGAGGVVDVLVGLGVAVEDLGDAGLGLEEVAHGGEMVGVGDVDVGDLVVNDGEGAGGEEVGVEHAGGLAGVEEAGLAQEAVGEDGALGADGFDGVVACEDPGAVLVFGGGDEGFDLGDEFVEGGGGLGGVGAVALLVVVEGGQVEEEVVGGVGALEDGAGGLGDPASDAGAGEGAPVVVEVEGASEGGAEFGVEGFGAGVAVEDESAVVAVDGLGRDDEVEGFAEALLEEGHADGLAGAPGLGPDAGSVDEGGGLFPEPGSGEVVVVPAGGDDAVLGDGQGGAEGGLGGTGEGEGAGRDGAEVEPGGGFVVMDDVPA